MAYALVSGQTANASVTAATGTVTLPNNPQPGNLVVVSCHGPTSGTYSCKDSNNVVYTKTPSSPLDNGGGLICVVFYLPNAPSNATKSITVTFPASASVDIFAAEFSGGAPGSVLEADITATPTGVTAITVPSITTIHDGALLIGAATVGGAVTSANSPWTGIGAIGTFGNYAEFLIQAKRGAQAVNFTSTSGSAAVILTAFSPGPPAGTAPTKGIIFTPGNRSGPMRGLRPTRAFPITPSVPDISEQVWNVWLQEDDPLEQYEDDWFSAYGQTDTAAGVTDVSEQIWNVWADEEEIPQEDDALILRLEDQVDLVYSLLDEQEAIDEVDDHWVLDRQSDLVFDTDQVVSVPDEQEAPYEEDDATALDRLLDLVFDTDQVIVVLDEQEARDEVDDDSTQPGLLDQVYDTDQVVFVADEQVVDPDEDADYYDAYGQIDNAPAPGNNEQIVFIADTQDVDFVPDDEADLWDAYGQVDTPLPPPAIFAVNKFMQIHVGALGVIPQNEAT